MDVFEMHLDDEEEILEEAMNFDVQRVASICSSAAEMMEITMIEGSGLREGNQHTLLVSPHEVLAQAARRAGFRNRFISFRWGGEDLDGFLTFDDHGIADDAVITVIASSRRIPGEHTVSAFTGIKASSCFYYEAKSLRDEAQSEGDIHQR